MTPDERTPLQTAIYEAIARSDKTRDHFDGLLRKKLGTTGKPLWDVERGKTKRPGPKTLRAIEDVLGFGPDFLVDLVHPREARATTPSQPDDDGIDMVGIQLADLDLGMGATFIDNHVEAEVLQFPRKWIETITFSPAELLTWARGRGDSMFPTISDGDLVLLDRSQTSVREQDAIWAFTVGDVGSIKRLRVKGDRYVILSDNSSVPADEEPQDFVRIVGRVVFVGAKK
ncbi:S24 family peptidase [Sphingomonas sp. GC_Shp_3]|uniref:S24 family peptidase n=1 Tax=Sphingomonas sp. GC_Shp_3 TaxID=2937383 RepID=UPI00226A9879|nr:S24 family peptidase [Sphingomonas sp. GC_Shp_3]